MYHVKSHWVSRLSISFLFNLREKTISDHLYNSQNCVGFLLGNFNKPRAYCPQNFCYFPALEKISNWEITQASSATNLQWEFQSMKLLIFFPNIDASIISRNVSTSTIATQFKSERKILRNYFGVFFRVFIVFFSFLWNFFHFFLNFLLFLAQTIVFFRLFYRKL